jgi:uncharacterized protein
MKNAIRQFKRIEVVVLREEVELYKEFVRPYYLNRDSAHNFRHIERMIARLNLFAQGISPPPNLDRLYFLTCFHGLRTHLHDDETFRDRACAFLHELGWTQNEVDEAFQSLDCHLTIPQTVEEQIVHDANSIELLGAFGIAKAFTTGGARGQSYEETIEIFEALLDKARFYTPMGKRIAEERKVYTKAFIQHLRSEW